MKSGGWARPWRALALSSIAVPLAGVPSPAHHSTDKSTSCHGACRVLLTKSLTLGGPIDQFLSGRPAAVARDRVGRFFVLLRGRDGGSVGVYDAGGRFSRQLAAIGDGPGQVRYPHWIDVGFDDTLRVFQKSRITVFDGDLQAVRQIKATDEVRFQSSVALLSRRQYVVLASLPPPDPMPVFVRDLVGSTTRRIPGITPGLVAHAVTRAQGDRFWVAAARWDGGTGYLLRLTNTRGANLGTITRRPSWWVGRDTTVDGPTHARFWGSTVTAIRVVKNRLFVLIRTPKPAWVRAGDKQGSSRGYQTVLEVVDLTTRRAVSAEPVDGEAVSLLGDGRMATYRETGAGIPVVDIWTPSFRAPLKYRRPPRRAVAAGS